MKESYMLMFCAVVMISIMQLRRKLYGLLAWKALAITVFAGCLGYLGTYMMYFLENWEWGGKSFFGAVLFYPILLFPVACLFKLPLSSLLDYATPSGIALLAPFKLSCHLSGCCGGRVMWYSEKGVPTHFPSQLVEMAVALAITFLLLCAEKRRKYEGEIYPLCLIAYGGTRFILNYFRWDRSVFFWGLPPGNFWALVSIVIGIVWIFASRRQKTKAC